MYSRYLPCSTLYEDPSVTDSFVPGKHCAFSFTHEAAKGMDMAMAKKYADNILSIIHKGGVPPITKVHADRVLSQGFPPMIPEFLKQKIPLFDPTAVNKNVEGLFALYPGCIKVERIATSMGCIVTTCVAEVQQLIPLTQGIISWAKPVIETNNAKAQVCMEWRKTLEREACVPPADPAAQARMQVGALFSPEEANLEIPLSKLAEGEGYANKTSEALQEILRL